MIGVQAQDFLTQGDMAQGAAVVLASGVQTPGLSDTQKRAATDLFQSFGVNQETLTQLGVVLDNARLGVQGKTTSQTALIVPTTALAYTPNIATDFLLQDVCVDSNDVAIAGDPATCPYHRDIRFGEFIPYIHTDMNGSGRASAWYTYPAQAPDGSLVVMRQDDWGGFVANASFRDQDVSNPADGIDTIEANGTDVSITGTQNNLSGFLPLWNPSCTHDDTWKLFPVTAAPGANGSATSSLSFSVSCPTGFASALNLWHYYSAKEPTTYTSGKQLQSLVVWHYDNADPNKAGSFEQLYFTKEYGVTRWEAWQTRSNCAAVAAAQGLNEANYCKPETSGMCNGVNTLSNVWGKDYFRVDCRDFTNTQNLSIPFNPLTNTFGGGLVFSKNLLTAGDFAQGHSNGWQLNSQTVLSVLNQNTDKNWYLSMQCKSSCSADSKVYQDVSAATLSGTINLQYGAIIGASEDATADISISLLDAQGAVVVSKTASFKVGTSTLHTDDSLSWDFSAHPVQTIRFQVTPIHDVVYSLDEAYVTPAIPNPVTMLATYKGYVNGTLSVTTPGLTRADALAQCKASAASNPASSTRCTWMDTEIYSAAGTAPPPPVVHVYQAESAALYHSTGRAESDGWSATVSKDTPGAALSFGPYASDWGSGNVSVTFDLMVDNNTQDNSNVVTIDIYDYTATQELTSRTITRKEFNSISIYQPFTLQASLAGRSGHQMETRVVWGGTSYLKLDKITATI